MTKYRRKMRNEANLKSNQLKMATKHFQRTMWEPPAIVPSGRTQRVNEHRQQYAKIQESKKAQQQPLKIIKKKKKVATFSLHVRFPNLFIPCRLLTNRRPTAQGSAQTSPYSAGQARRCRCPVVAPGPETSTLAENEQRHSQTPSAKTSIPSKLMNKIPQIPNLYLQIRDFPTILPLSSHILPLSPTSPPIRSSLQPVLSPSAQD